MPLRSKIAVANEVSVLASIVGIGHSFGVAAGKSRRIRNAVIMAVKDEPFKNGNLRPKSLPNISASIGVKTEPGARVLFKH